MSYYEREAGSYTVPQASVQTIKRIIHRHQQEKAKSLLDAAVVLKEVVNGMDLKPRKRLIKGEYRHNIACERLIYMLSTLYPIASELLRSVGAKQRMNELSLWLSSADGKHSLVDFEVIVLRKLGFSLSDLGTGKISLLDAEHPALAGEVLREMTGASRLKAPKKALINKSIQSITAREFEYVHDCMILTFDSKTRTLSYDIEENNGSVDEVYSRCQLFKDLMGHLKVIKWTRTSGGYAQYVGEEARDMHFKRVLGNAKLPEHYTVLAA